MIMSWAINVLPYFSNHAYEDCLSLNVDFLSHYEWRTFLYQINKGANLDLLHKYNNLYIIYFGHIMKILTTFKASLATKQAFTLSIVL